MTGIKFSAKAVMSLMKKGMYAVIHSCLKQQCSDLYWRPNQENEILQTLWKVSIQNNCDCFNSFIKSHVEKRPFFSKIYFVVTKA